MVLAGAQKGESDGIFRTARNDVAKWTVDMLRNKKPAPDEQPHGSGHGGVIADLEGKIRSTHERDPERHVLWAWARPTKN